MTYIEFFQSLKADKLSSAYFFWGEEDYLVQQAINKIVEKTVDPTTSDFNLDILYGSETNGGKIVEIASSLPMMANQRCVVVKELHKLKVQDMKAIGQYLERPSKLTYFIMTAPKLNFNLSQNKIIKKKATCVEFKALYDNHVFPWIRNHLKKYGFQINDDAIRLLHDNVGNSLRELVNELDKIILNTDERTMIKADDVRHVVGLSRGYSIFELSNAIGMRDFNRSLKIVTRMLELGEPPISIITMLTRHFSILLKIKHGLQLNWPQSELAKIAGVSRYFFKDYIIQSNNYARDQLQRSFHFLLNADVNLKTSYQSAKLILELLIYHLTKS